MRFLARLAREDGVAMVLVVGLVLVQRSETSLSEREPPADARTG